MSVIVDLRVSSTAFELGQILALPSSSTLKLESMIPLGQKAVPFFWVYNGNDDSFIETVQNHPTVDDFDVIEEHEDRKLYSLKWNVERDHFFDGLAKTKAHLLGATGTADSWEFDIRFPSHQNLSRFKKHCENAHVPLEVLRIYNPTRPDSGPHFGLTDAQREALQIAVAKGYYSIPRRCSTKDLAEELQISDQAATERLRRGIETFVRNAFVDVESEQP